MKAMVDPQVPAWGEANKPRVFDFLRFLDGELKTRPYVAGEEFTVADITDAGGGRFHEGVEADGAGGACRGAALAYAQVSARPSAAA